MDEENRKTSSIELGVDFERSFLPILTAQPEAPYFEGSIEPRSDVMKAVWIGRLEDFKVPILLHALERLDRIESISIQFDVIGDGAERGAVSAFAAGLSRLKVNFLGNINYAALDGALKGYDVVFAMGTSALEGAKLGIPTFCLDYAYSLIKGNYRFRGCK
jgi:hypothetical protein